MPVTHDHTGLDCVDPATHPARDATAFRRIVAATEAVHNAETELIDAVTEARRRGDSWTAIAVALGTTRQAAQQRFGKLTG
ncbi:hypothetical protein [Mycobacterium sp.]|uniref:hypothetical protein n=1 Tax=Mycobacterium sp. TaxID=1785 RepID=UPI001278B7D1|nr:hypothetical protein [Mycobacterium sp.]KAA8954327.1 MAG: hypothetical protein F6Q13_17675 [Mycobacterium sp.]